MIARPVGAAREARGSAGEASGRRLHVAVINGDLPYPPAAGNRIRTLNLVLRLAKRHQLTFLTRGLGDPAEVREGVAFLEDHGVRCIVAHHPLPGKSGPRLYAGLAGNLFSGRPYAAALHTSRPLRGAAAEFAQGNRVDLWQVEWLSYAEAVPRGAPGRVVITAHNVEAQIWKRYYENERRPLRRWYVGGQWRKFRRYEARTLQRADRVIAVSEEDAGLLRREYGLSRVDVVDNGVDKEYFGSVRAERDARRVLFLGSLEWRPNLDAVRLLLEEVFPAVVAREPSARLCVVGRNPPAWLAERIRRCPWAELHGNVPDVRPYLTGSGVMAVPLRIGGGSRLKILEALAAGLPVVSTRVGAEGLCLRPDVEITVVEELGDMAAAVVRCLRRPEEARQMAERGREVVLERYDWGPLADRMERIWQQCVLG